MEDHDKISFKVYLKTAGSEQEVRRFLTERKTSTDYNLLVEKLWMLFPQLQDSDFSLTWTDNEGDTITVNTDEELSLALSEMPGEPYKLNLTIKEESGAPCCTERGATRKKKQVKTICLSPIVICKLYFHPCLFQQMEIPDLCVEVFSTLRPIKPIPRIYENVRLWQPRESRQPLQTRQARAPESISAFETLRNFHEFREFPLDLNQLSDSE